MTATIVPAIQKGCTTGLTQSPEEWQQVVDLILQYSTDVHIGSDGLLGQGEAPAEAPVDDSDDVPEGDDGAAAPEPPAEDGEAAG